MKFYAAPYLCKQLYDQTKGSWEVPQNDWYELNGEQVPKYDMEFLAAMLPDQGDWRLTIQYFSAVWVKVGFYNEVLDEWGALSSGDRMEDQACQLCIYLWQGTFQPYVSIHQQQQRKPMFDRRGRKLSFY